MLAGPSLTLRLAEKPQVRVLVLGTGAGLLPMFLKGQLGDKLAEIVTVDINEEVIKVMSNIIDYTELMFTF
jgi:tRNA1(Val) A37 N6-methylase TrmN6